MSHLRNYALILLAICFRFAVAAGAGNVTVAADGFTPLWVKEPDGRGTWTIIYSSAVTLFLSAWMTLHLNIYKHDETWKHMVVRHLLWGCCSFLFPETIVFVAFQQWLVKFWFLKELNAARERYIGVTGPGVNTEPREDLRDPFTNLYGWYAEMGGFCIDLNFDAARVMIYDERYNFIPTTNARLTLSRKGILDLASHGLFIQATDKSIQDKSKADNLAKAFVCVQVIWFTCQVIQRKIAGLPISILEFHVLANIGFGLITYLLWWNKPRNVETATIVHTSTVQEVAVAIMSETDNHQFPRLCTQTYDCEKSPRSANPCALVWICSKVSGTTDRSHSSDTPSVQFNRYFPRLTKRVVISSPGDLTGHTRESDENLLSHALQYAFNRVAESWEPLNLRRTQTGSVARLNLETNAEDELRNERQISALMTPLQEDSFCERSENSINEPLPKELKGLVRRSYTAIFLIIPGYGALHLIPALTGFHFPSRSEELLWELSCYFIIGCIVAVPLMDIYDKVEEKFKSLTGQKLFQIATLVVISGYTLIVVLARLYLMVEAFISIRKERPEIFQTPAWNWLDYIPHF